MAEQPAHNRLGLGSNPGGPTTTSLLAELRGASKNFDNNKKASERREGEEDVDRFARIATAFYSFAGLGCGFLAVNDGFIAVAYFFVFLSAFCGWMGGFETPEIEAILKKNREEINK